MEHKYILDKNIWLTGASSGIGFEIAKALSKFKTNLILTSRNSEKLTNAIMKLQGEAKKYAFPMDVSSESQVREAFEFISHEVGFPDILINNAGIFKSKSFIETKIEDFEEVINVNLRGVFNTTQSVLPAMLENDGGTIINIISITALQPFPNCSIYAASKAGLLAMMQGIREEVRKNNIKIINIIPAATATEIWDEKFLEKNKNLMSSPKDIADLVVSTLQLCSSNTSMIEDIIIKPQVGF
jgi:short-subunit dehydrogenase